MLLITHNLESVFDVSDRIIVMRLGAKIADIRTADAKRADVVGMIVGAHEWL